MALLDLIIAAEDGAARGIWSDTFGLIFTYGILIPAIVTVCIIVAMVTGRGDKQEDDEIRARWGRKRPPTSS